MILTGAQIARMVDLSAVQANDSDETIALLVRYALHYQTCLVTTLPCQMLLAKALLGDSTVGLGGNVGFPSGGNTTNVKILETHELVQIGCDEIDVVINISYMVSGKYQSALEDIRAVVDAAAGIPVKVILECHYLTGDQIRTGCDLCIEAGAAFVKTGTGWAPSGATLENIHLIKSHVGEAIAIKASGGIRSLDTLIAMYRLGARRFGIGLHHAVTILDEVNAFPGGAIEF